MDFVTSAQLYGVVATAIAGTSYFTLYRPSIALTEEIVGEELPLHSGWVGITIWFLLSGIVAPWTALLLLKNDNEEFIESFAVSLADRLIEDE